MNYYKLADLLHEGLHAYLYCLKACRSYSKDEESPAKNEAFVRLNQIKIFLNEVIQKIENDDSIIFFNIEETTHNAIQQTSDEKPSGPSEDPLPLLIMEYPQLDISDNFIVILFILLQKNHQATFNYFIKYFSRYDDKVIEKMFLFALDSIYNENDLDLITEDFLELLLELLIVLKRDINNLPQDVIEYLDVFCFNDIKNHISSCDLMFFHKKTVERYLCCMLSLLLNCTYNEDESINQIYIEHIIFLSQYADDANLFYVYLIELALQANLPETLQKLFSIKELQKYKAEILYYIFCDSLTETFYFNNTANKEENVLALIVTLLYFELVSKEEIACAIDESNLLIKARNISVDILQDLKNNDLILDKTIVCLFHYSVMRGEEKYYISLWYEFFEIFTNINLIYSIITNKICDFCFFIDYLVESMSIFQENGINIKDYCNLLVPLLETQEQPLLFFSQPVKDFLDSNEELYIPQDSIQEHLQENVSNLEEQQSDFYDFNDC